MQCFPAICGSDARSGSRRPSLDPMNMQEQNVSGLILDPQKHPTEVREALDFISKGGNLIKIRSKNSQQERLFKVDNGGMTLCYLDSKKNRFQSKGNDQSQIYIHKIKEIREGLETDVFLQAFHNKPNAPESSCCFTLFISGERTLDLVAPDAETKALWLTGLSYLMKFFAEGDPGVIHRLFVEHQFHESDVNNEGVLDMEQILKLMKLMNISVEEDYAKEICHVAKDLVLKKNGVLNEAPMEKENSLTLEEFTAFFSLIEKQEEIDELFKKYDNGNGQMTVRDLTLFWRKEQQEELKPEEIQKIIESCEVCPDLKAKSILSLSGFHAMVQSDWMDIRNRKCQTVYQDMDQPLCHYFIDSSHNTYLKEDQLLGPSEIECYIWTLKMGCRCIELDVWDGSDDVPVIYHGYTFTTKIDFLDVINAINKAAFETSEFPVILSIENHCSLDQQKIMADNMRTIFGSKMLIEPLAEGTTNLPSPNELKGRIIIKGKKLPKALLEDDDDDVSDEDEAADMEDDRVKEEVEQKKNKGGKQKLSQELSSCVIICQSISFKSFEQSKEKTTFEHISSLVERKALDLAENQCDGFLQHNMWQLSRIYPAGSRTDSSNFDPVPLWRAGCQIVALNHQTPDLPMQVNKAMFEDNGRSGYVLKPEFMRKASADYSINGPYPAEWKKKLSIKVISGYQLPKKHARATGVLDPFIKIEIFGVPSDVQEKRTKTINDNGFHPVWNETFDFTVNCPDLAIILFRVYDNEDLKRDVVVAQYGLPVNCLRTGYQTVHLKNVRGEPLNVGSLFVHVSIMSD